MIGDQEPDQHLTFVWTGIGKMRSKGTSHFDDILRVLEEGVTNGHYVFQICMDWYRENAVQGYKPL
jgi:hypothetical protein